MENWPGCVLVSGSMGQWHHWLRNVIQPGLILDVQVLDDRRVNSLEPWHCWDKATCSSRLYVYQYSNDSLQTVGGKDVVYYCEKPYIWCVYMKKCMRSVHVCVFLCVRVYTCMCMNMHTTGSCVRPGVCSVCPGVCVAIGDQSGLTHGVNCSQSSHCIVLNFLLQRLKTSQ